MSNLFHDPLSLLSYTLVSIFLLIDTHTAAKEITSHQTKKGGSSFRGIFLTLLFLFLQTLILIIVTSQFTTKQLTQLGLPTGYSTLFSTLIFTATYTLYKQAFFKKQPLPSKHLAHTRNIILSHAFFPLAGFLAIGALGSLAYLAKQLLSYT